MATIKLFSNIAFRVSLIGGAQDAAFGVHALSLRATNPFEGNEGETMQITNIPLAIAGAKNAAGAETKKDNVSYCIIRK